MNITSITGYTPNRQAQKVNFGDVNIGPCIKEKCGIDDDDIRMFNNRCPKNWDIYVNDNGPMDRIRENVVVNVFYKGTNELVTKPLAFYIYQEGSERTKKINHNRCITFVKGAINYLKAEGFKKGK